MGLTDLGVDDALGGGANNDDRNNKKNNINKNDKKNNNNPSYRPDGSRLRYALGVGKAGLVGVGAAQKQQQNL